MDLWSRNKLDARKSCFCQYIEENERRILIENKKLGQFENFGKIGDERYVKDILGEEEDQYYLELLLKKCKKMSKGTKRK